MEIDLTNAHPCPGCRQCLTNADKCRYCTERDQLRAENERLQAQSKAALLNAKQSQDGWSEALKLRDTAIAAVEAAPEVTDANKG
jgi:hypothetical protein